MKKAKPAGDEEREKRRPRMGKRIISEKQARCLAGKAVEPESFLNDPSDAEQSMEESYRRPTMEEMREAQRRQHAERQAEFKDIGRTGKELFGPLPKMKFKMPAPRDIPSSDSEADMSAASDKENNEMDESMGKDEEMEKEVEKEADETTPLGQQRSMGVSGRSSATSTPAGHHQSIASTPPARPDSEFRRPALPPHKTLPRHSTPKMNARPRDSFGAAFNNISIIANTSLQGAPSDQSGRKSIETRSTNNTRKASTESRGTATLDVVSIIEEDDNEEQAAPKANGRSSMSQQSSVAANGTFVVEKSATAANGTFVVEREEREEEVEEDEKKEEEEEGSVRVHVEAIAMRRQSIRRDVTIASMDGVESVEVVELSMRRQSPPARPSLPSRPPTIRQSLPIQDTTMMSVDEDSVREEEGDNKRDDSEEMEDEEMASLHDTPVRRKSIRPAKRPSLEHPITTDSSPMAVAMAGRSGGLREAMMRPKLSVQCVRKISTGSVSSSIPLEDISQNLSMSGSEQSYVDPKTPERTPRATRLLRASLAARDMRQSQHVKLAVLEESTVPGEESEEEEEEEDEMEEIQTQRRRVETGERRDVPSTPVNRQPRLSSRLQSSVDRLSQPRHRHENAQPCARLACSPARVPAQRSVRPSTMSSPSPARRLHSFNQTRGREGMMSGYTPNHRIDTTLMEDSEANAKSGMAPRIKRIARRDHQGGGGGGREATVAAGAVLNMSGEERGGGERREDREEAGEGEQREQLGVEAERRVARERNARLADESDHQAGAGIKDSPHLAHGITSTVTSPYAHSTTNDDEHTNNNNDNDDDQQQQQHDYHSFDGGDDMEGEEEEGGVEQRANSSMASASMISMSSASDNGVFVRPANPPPAPALPPTPTSVHQGGGRRSVGDARRRSMWSDSDGNEDMDRLSSRASQISIDDGAAPANRRATMSSSHDSFDAGPRSPNTPFRRAVARNSDLYSTDTPGIDRRRHTIDASPTFMNTEEEDSWAADQDSSQWRGDVTTEEDENAAVMDESQMDIIEEDDVRERVLAPRKLIAPTASPGVRRSQRTRIKPTRTWLGETAQYELSPTTGERKLVGVNEVVIRDKVFVKYGTADIQQAVEAKMKTTKQRAIANKKKKAQRRAQQEAEDSD